MGNTFDWESEIDMFVDGLRHEGDGDYSITLDFCHDSVENIPGYVEKYSEDENENISYNTDWYAKHFGVSHNIVKFCGPGGGWPEVEFIGTRGAIADMLLDYVGVQHPTSEQRQYVLEKI